jgi:hypothetical protein
MHFLVSLVLWGLILAFPSTTVAAQKAEGPGYTVVDKTVVGGYTGSNAIWKVILHTDTLPGKRHLRQTATKVWKSGNTLWERFTVFAFLPKMDTEKIAYGIAEFGHGGLSRLTLQDFALHGTAWAQPEAEVIDTPKPTINKPEPREYRISLQVGEVARSKILLDVKTNLPDSARLEVAVRRPYYERSQDRKACYGMLFTGTLPVVDGGIKQEIALDDRTWYRNCLSRKDAPEEPFPGFRSISPMLEVRVCFRPARDQPPSVVRTTGGKGELMRGKQVREVEGINTLTVTTRAEIHFSRVAD